MITRRRYLVGTAGLLARPTLAQGGTVPLPGDAPDVLVRLEPDRAIVLGPGPSPVGALRLTGPDGTSTLRLRQGETASLRVLNDTPDTAGIEIHGLRGWGAVDAPDAQALRTIMPGQSRTCRIKPADSGTAWLRARASSGGAAARGAAAVLLIAENAPPAVDHDLPLLLQDWLLGADGQVRFGSIPPADATQRILTVNGRTSPQLLTARPRGRVRLRLVNASTQRVMLVACVGAKPSVVAVDGQPCDPFVPVRDMIPVAPGARFDLLTDLPDAQGQEVRLILRGTERLNGAAESDRPVLLIRTDGSAREARPPFRSLPANPALPVAIALEAAKRADLSFATAADGGLAGWTINGRPSGPDPVLTVRQHEIVTLGLFNSSGLLVPMRVEGQAMRILHARDDGWDPYWRDTVLLPPRSRTHVAFVADTPGRWAIESGFDDQLLAGLRCVFVVTPR